MAGFRASTTHCLRRVRTCLLGVSFAAPLLLAACAKAPPLPPSSKSQPPTVDCQVPNLTEESESAIEAQLARAKLHLGTVTDQESNQRPGTVIEQLPRPAATVKCGSHVDVWIAVSPKREPPDPSPPKPEPAKPDPTRPMPVTIVVPRLDGRDQMAATRMLETVGLHIGEVGRRPSDSPPDTVVGQFPVAGTTVQPGATVQIWLAVPRPATVPELRGRDRAGAANALTSARLALGQVVERPSDDPPGTVVGQSPSAGTVVKPGVAVQVWLAVPRPIEVPALVGRREADAAVILRKSRLRPGEVRFRESFKPKGVVLEQAPQAGQRVNADTSVDLWLATPVKVLVPDVRGRNQRSAAEALASVGLVVGDVREREDSSARGTVLDQLPAPQSQVVAGTSVALSIAVPRVPVAPPPPPVAPPPAVQPLPPVQPPPSVQPSTPIAVAPLQVPPVVGLSLNQAFLRLESAGLRPGRVSEVREATAAGNVTAQFPAAGSAARPGAQVDLVVAASVSRAPGSWAPATPPLPTVASRDPVQTFITERMRPASAAFYAPAQMQRDQPSEVLVEIAPPTISPADLAMELSIVAGKMKSIGASVPMSATEGVTASGLIRAAPRMVASLSADRACTITPKDPLDRAVALDERVRWRWLVTPKVAGPISLTATLSAPVVLDGKETSYSIRSFDKTVTVLVTNQQRASDALEWAKNHWVMLVFAGGSFLGLLRWLWSHIRTPAPPPPPSPKQLPE